VAATLPRSSSTAAEEAQYLAAVLQNDAKQARHTLPAACCSSTAEGQAVKPVLHATLLSTSLLAWVAPGAGVHAVGVWKRLSGVSVRHLGRH
jgi:hypothetical protein